MRKKNKKNYINWIQKAKKELKNIKLDNLYSKTPDGIKIKPLYTVEDLKDLEPLDVFEMAVNGDSKAINVWDDFGENLGLVLSHFINMIDPDRISIGGGISGAFKFFESKMKESVSIHCPAYNNFKIDIFESKKKELSSQVGSALLVKNSKLIL